jgi:hypothetical protein
MRPKKSEDKHYAEYEVGQLILTLSLSFSVFVRLVNV